MNINDIWFLRLYKMPLTDENSKEIETLDICKPYIYSLHGSCSKISKEELAEKYFSTTDFDKIRKIYTRKDFIKILLKISENNNINRKEASKEMCPYILSFWVYWIKIGDIVFVRKSSDVIYICKIVSDVELGNNWQNFIYPKRYVKVLKKFTYEDLTKKLACGKNRLNHRRTLQRVDKNTDKEELIDFLLSIKQPRLLSNKIIIMVIIFVILLAILIGITF